MCLVVIEVCRPPNTSTGVWLCTAGHVGDSCCGIAHTTGLWWYRSKWVQCQWLCSLKERSNKDFHTLQSSLERGTDCMTCLDNLTRFTSTLQDKTYRWMTNTVHYIMQPKHSVVIDHVKQGSSKQMSLDSEVQCKANVQRQIL